MLRQTVRLLVCLLIMSGGFATAAAAAAATFDGDALADMPLYDASTGTWRVLTSVSGYRSSFTIYWGGPQYTPVPADYDGDGRIDIAVFAGAWYVLTSSSNFTTAMIVQVTPALGAPIRPVPGDYDHDGKADFAVMADDGSLTVRKSTNGSQWTISMPQLADDYLYADYCPVAVRGDFDGDGIADVALYRRATGRWKILTSSSNFQSIVAFTLGGPDYAAVTGDYDGDGKADPAVYNGATGEWKYLQSTTNTVATVGWGGTGFAPVPGDYDGDGKNDFGVYSSALGEWFVLETSTGLTTTLRAVWGTPVESPVTMTPVRSLPSLTKQATDYDGDGASDIAVYQPSSGTWTILTSSSRFMQTMTITWSGGPGDVPVPADYDMDGKTDLATYNPASGVWSIRPSYSLTPYTVTLGDPGDIPVPSPFIRPSEVTVYTPSTGRWRHVDAVGRGTFEFFFGSASDTPIPWAFGGSAFGRAGLYNAASGYWKVLSPNANPSLWQQGWGGPGYTPVPGDYDGDGQPDLSVCVKATGNCYVLKSGFNYASAFGLSWGAPLDRPISGDYDGDGLDDMANYDSATGQWSIRLSSSNYTLTLHRTLGGPGYLAPR
jgi:hypothetical protein